MVALLLPCATTWVSLLAGWCLLGATHRGPPWMPAVTQAQSAPLMIEPSAGCRLRPLGEAAPAPDLALLVKHVRQRRRLDPDIRVAADPFGREGQDRAVEAAHE